MNPVPTPHCSLFYCFQDVSIPARMINDDKLLGMETPRRWKDFWKHLWKQDLLKTLVECPRMGIFMETPGNKMETLWKHMETKWKQNGKGPDPIRNTSDMIFFTVFIFFSQDLAQVQFQICKMLR